MSFFSDAAEWAQVYIIGIKDKVLGGVNGLSNAQGAALAKRTNWLKNLTTGTFISSASGGVVKIPDLVVNCILAGDGSVNVEFPDNPVDGQTLKILCASEDYSSVTFLADGDITDAQMQPLYGVVANFVYVQSTNVWHRCSSSKVRSVAGRTGAVTLTTADLTNWAAATASFLTSAPVSSVAGQTGSVTLTTADITNWSTATSGFTAPVRSVAGKTGAVTLTTVDITNWAAATGPMAKDCIQVACSNLTTALTVSSGIAVFRMPYAMTVSSIRASLATASTSGLVTIDVKKSGTTVFSTKLTIDANEKTSVTAATAAVISSSAFADDAEITVDITTAGTGAKGLVISIIGVAT